MSKTRNNLSVRDKRERVKTLRMTIRSLIQASFKPEPINIYNDKTVKGCNYVINHSYFITHFLKDFVIREGYLKNIQNKNYRSYIPVKLIDYVDDLVLQIFDEPADLDSLTDKQIEKAEQYLGITPDSKKRKAS